MKLDRSGVFRRFLQSKAAGILPLAAGTAQGDMHAEALIRGMLQEARPEETWNAPLLETRFVVADTETTGFNPNTDAIIAVGAVEMEGNRILAERTFHKFVHLGSDKRVPPVVTKLTGIRNEDLADAPPITEVLQQFLAFVKDGVLVMHHSYHDVRFLNAALWKQSRSHLTHRVIDTFDVAKWLRPRLNQYSLDDLLEVYRIPVEGRHTALGDALMTAKLWGMLLEESVARGVTTVGELYEQVVLAKL